MDASDPADFPSEIDAGMVKHACADQFAKGFNICGSGFAGIDQEVAVFLTDLRAPYT